MTSDSLYQSALKRTELLLVRTANLLHCRREGHQWTRYQRTFSCKRCLASAEGSIKLALLRKLDESWQQLTDDEVVNTFGVGEQGFKVPARVVFPTEVEFVARTARIEAAFMAEMGRMLLEIDWNSLAKLAQANFEKLRSEHSESMSVETLALLRQAARNLAVRRMCESVCVNHGWRGCHFVPIFTDYVFQTCSQMIIPRSEEMFNESSNHP